MTRCARATTHRPPTRAKQGRGILEATQRFNHFRVTVLCRAASVSPRNALIRFSAAGEVILHCEIALCGSKFLSGSLLQPCVRFLVGPQRPPHHVDAHSKN